jgi:hypothetical protein
VIALTNSGFHESRKFLGQLSNYQFFKEDHAPWSAVFPVHMLCPAEQLPVFKEDPAPWSALFPIYIHNMGSLHNTQSTRIRQYFILKSE